MPATKFIKSKFLMTAAAVVMTLGVVGQASITPAKAGKAGYIALGVGLGVLTAVAIDNAARANRPGPAPRAVPNRRPRPVNTQRAPRRPAVQINYAENMKIQNALNTLGYDAGIVDGVVGQGTRAAIRRFQFELDGNPTGRLTAKQKIILFDRASLAEAAQQTQSPQG